MLRRISDIFKKTAGSKAFWAGVLLCLTFTMINPSLSVADDDGWDYECPSMDVLRERYQGDCFPCQIVNVLLASFMRAAGRVYDVSKEAGSKLLLLGSILWLAFWALKKMSSLSNVEPASMSNELVVFFSKVVVAYCFINAGIGTLVNYAINPILGAGADFGTALLLEAENMDISSAPKSENAYTGPTEIVDKSTMDKILKLSESVSNEVAMNLIIGNALTCFSIRKGIHFTMFIDIHIPDIWLWLVGAAIWCAGFMFVLSVCYYLIDIPFKIGFAIIALPVVIGLWPFKITSGKLKDVVMVAFNAAGTFLFLALSSSYAMRLISQSFSKVGSFVDDSGNTVTGTDALLYAISKDNVDAVDTVFSFTGGSFLIIMFCYIYGIKMISHITNKFPSKFFGEGITAGAGSPLHHMATAATMWASKKAAAPFKMAGDIVAHQAGKAATTAAKAAGNTGIGLAGAAAGSVSKSLGTGLQYFGKKMVGEARKNKEKWDALDRYDRLHQAGLQATVGNKLGKFGAKVKLGLANTAVKAGEHLETGSQYMTAPGERTLSRVHNAWSKGTEEIGSTIAQKQLSADEIKTQAREEFAAATAKLGESGRKLATYVPKSIGENVRGLGFYYTANAENSNNRVTSYLSSKLGAALTATGSGIVDNRPDAQTLRHKISNLKTVFSGKAVRAGLETAGERIGKALNEGIVTPWQTDVADLKASLGKTKDDVRNIGSDIVTKVKDSAASIKVSKENFADFSRMGADISGAYGELKKSATDLGQTLVKEHKLNTGAKLYQKGDLQNILAEQERLLKDSANAEALEKLHKKGISDLKDFAEGKLVLGKNSQAEMASFIQAFGTNSKGELTAEGRAAYDRLTGLTKDSNTLNRVATSGAALAGTAAGSLGGSMATMGVGAIAGRHLYNNTKEAIQETLAAYREGKIDNLFDAAGALAHPVMAIPLVLKNTASQTIESSYQVAEKTILAGLDVALTATSVLKEPGRWAAHTANIVGNGAKMVATPIMTGANIAIDVGEVAFKGVRTITRPVVNTAATLVFAPVGFAAKAIDETLYTAYKMTVRPAGVVGTAAVRGAKVLYKGVELGVKSTKVGRGTIRTFKAGGKTLKVGVKTLKLGREIIRAAAGEGGYSNEALTREEKEQMRKERKMRRQAEKAKERKKQEAREREEQEAQRQLEEFQRRQEEEAAQSRAEDEDEAARQAAQAEAERRDAAEEAAAQSEQEADHQPSPAERAAQEESNSIKNYSKDDLQEILDTHEQLLNGTNNGTAFESLHENSVSDLQKFAEGKVTIDKDSYATMVPFIKTFGTDDKGQLTDVGRAAQQKLTSLMTGGSSGGSSGGTSIPH